MIDFIKQHALYFILGFVALFFLGFAFEVVNTLLLIVAIASVALAWSCIASYAFTRIPPIRKILYGKDDALNSIEQSGMYKLFGYIFLGVNILVGLVSLAVYIVQFAK